MILLLINYNSLMIHNLRAPNTTLNLIATFMDANKLAEIGFYS